MEGQSESLSDYRNDFLELYLSMFSYQLHIKNMV